MAIISKSMVALRVSGPEVDPEEITKLLGQSPSQSQKKGEVFRNERLKRERTAKQGMWILHAEDREPEDFDAQIIELLDSVTGDLEVWSQITSKHNVDLFCGAFMESTNEGMSLSPKSHLEIGKRGLEFNLEIYAPCEGDA